MDLRARLYHYRTVTTDLRPGFMIMSPEGRINKVERAYSLSSDAWYLRLDNGSLGEVVGPDQYWDVVSDN